MRIVHLLQRNFKKIHFFNSKIYLQNNNIPHFKFQIRSHNLPIIILKLVRMLIFLHNLNTPIIKKPIKVHIIPLLIIKHIRIFLYFLRISKPKSHNRTILKPLNKEPKLINYPLILRNTTIHNSAFHNLLLRPLLNLIFLLHNLYYINHLFIIKIFFTIIIQILMHHTIQKIKRIPLVHLLTCIIITSIISKF